MKHHSVFVSLVSLWGLVTVGGCGSSATTPAADAGPDAIPAANPDCNVLSGDNCILPIPSSIYERDDSTSPTGVRVDFGANTLPMNGAGVHVDSDYYNTRDGFSADAPILTAFPEGFDPATLPPITDPGQSLLATCPTVIVDLTTMQRVPHFAEPDVNGIGPDDTALIIRPSARLIPTHRYAIGITTTLQSATDGVIARTPAFQAILDGKPTGNPRADRLTARYTATFAALAAVGVTKDSLISAWDFTVASDTSIRSDLETARDLTIASVGTNAQNLTFTVDMDTAGDDATTISRYVIGHFDAPGFLTGDAGDASTLARGSDGKPMVVGTYSAPFYLEVPACATTATLPLPVVVYGHGLLGDGSEITSHNVEYFANYSCSIVIATDWRGMATGDIASVASALVDANNFPLVVDHLVQGMIDFIALEQIVRGPMATSTTFQQNGVPLIDPTRVYYYGNSQGGIYGGTFMAYDPIVMLGILGVPGANYATLLERSSDWVTYHGIQRNAYPDPLDSEILLHLFQMDWDRVDPITTTAGLIGQNGDPVPNTPAKQILMIEAVGDSQVTNISTETEARTMNIPVLAPSSEMPYALTGTPGPLSSALQIVNEHPTPLPPLTNSAAPDNGTHGSVRGRQAIQTQMKLFFETGQIVQTCEDASSTPVGCDCPTQAICGPGI